MRKFSSNVPIASELFIEILLANTIILLHKSEEGSDASKFVTGLTFLRILFTTNHATEYTYIED